MWAWPLDSIEHLWPDEPGRFGTVRTHDIHSGVDLYCEPGTHVLAVEDSVIIGIEVFTGPATVPPSPWWHHTHAVLALGASGVVVYGEIRPWVEVGQRLARNEAIGDVKPVLKASNGRPGCMLHLELMRPYSTRTVWWLPHTQQPHELLDPTSFLKFAASDLKQFTLANYNGTDYTTYEQRSSSHSQQQSL